MYQKNKVYDPGSEKVVNTINSDLYWTKFGHELETVMTNGHTDAEGKWQYSEVSIICSCFREQQWQSWTGTECTHWQETAHRHAGTHKEAHFDSFKTETWGYEYDMEIKS